MGGRIAVIGTAALVLVGAGLAVAVKLRGDRSSDDGPATDAPVRAVDVRSTGSAVTFTVRAGPGPAPTIPDLQPFGDAVDIVPLVRPAGPSTVRFTVDRSRLPANTPSCPAPTTRINVGIAAYDDVLHTWLPLPTTCTGDTLEAPTSHFSWFQVYVLAPGRHAVTTIIAGIERTIYSASEVTTSIALYVADLLEQVLVTIMRNGLGVIDPAAFVCKPPGKNRTSTASDRFLRLADSCVVTTTPGDQLHIKNGYAYPVAFPLQGKAATYLTRVKNDGAADAVVAGEELMGLLQGRAIITGLSQGAFDISAKAPASFTVSGDIDEAAFTVDVGVALLTVFVARAGPEGPGALRSMAAAVHQTLARASVGKAVSLAEIKDAISAVVREKPSWSRYGAMFLGVVNAGNCAASVRQGKPVDIALGCLSTAFSASNDLTKLLIDLATQVKVVPEYVQGKLATTVRWTGVSRIGVTVTSRWKRLVGRWGSVWGRMLIKADGTGSLRLQSWNSCDPPPPIHDGPCSNEEVTATFTMVSWSPPNGTIMIQTSASPLLPAKKSLRFVFPDGFLIFDLGPDYGLGSGPYLCKEGEIPMPAGECA
jgi:hypothetical protein